jgi:hypothetical protein
VSTAPVLSRRALNRAMLARQHLLERTDRSALRVIEHLVGMQAQLPRDPYLGLWSRIEDFDPTALERLLLDRAVVRTPLMRATLHLATAQDGLALRPLMQPVLDRTLRSNQARRGFTPADLEALAGEARALLDAQPRTFVQLREALSGRWQQHDQLALGYSVSYLVPLVQVPPRGLWTQTANATWTTTEAWLGKPVQPGYRLDDLVRRYLRAFGPASVRDMQTWCGLTRLVDVFERLRPELATFRDEHGVEIFDLPDAPRPHEDTPAPPRFLPVYDNVLLSHSDRTRIVPGAYRATAATANTNVTYVLVDGTLAGRWNLERDREAATLHIEPLGRWRKRDRDAVAAEGRRLLAFLVPGASSRTIAFADA